MRVIFLPSVERKDEEGIDYPKVPNTSLQGMCGAFVGPHFANPKSDNCKKFPPQNLQIITNTHLWARNQICKEFSEGGGCGFRV
jgi:hypothetical protein